MALSINGTERRVAEKQKAIPEDGLLFLNLNGARGRTRTDTSFNGGF
jgi:hypothetical protein